MTAPARISQADIERTLKSIKAAGFKSARVVLHLKESRIEVFLDGATLPAPSAPNEWDDEC